MPVFSVCDSVRGPVLRKDHWRSSKAKGLSSAAEDAHKETEKEVKDMGVVFGREADIRLIQKAWQLQ
ncbi:hypothetical protein RRG08_004466 [Elysia crispata]|uniref:Uncharacterized protein n=1 Tax=Elysia crispata TaxID=231223 RepID=A0AAE1AXX5_9GAST|nr:hypothetical protein RRG08_004466 [Elysia crispata]